MSARPPAVQAPPLAQVNLLPPEVRASRGLAKVKRWLALALVLAIVVAAGMVGKTIIDQGDADNQLAEAEDRTAELQAQAAEYAHVPIVMAALDQAIQARGYGMGSEILWRPYLDAIAATAPPGVRVENLQVVTATPVTPPVGATDALSVQGVSIITFTAQASTLADVEAWMTALWTVPGFSDPWYTVASLGTTNEVPMYTVNATVLVTSDAFTLRYDPARLAAEAAEAAAAGDADAADEEEE